jgi:UrcA family protein
MNTLNTLPVALLMMAAVNVAPVAAHADVQGRTFQVRFTYDAKAPAEDIYTDLRRTARKACDNLGVRSLQMRHVNRACAKRVVDAGVKTLGRADIAMLHHGGITTAAR